MVEKPLLAEGLGSRGGIKVKSVEAVEKGRDDRTGASDSAIGVVRASRTGSQKVEGHVAWRHIESDTGAGNGVERDIGKAPKVEAGIERGEQQTVADGDKGGTLAAESHIEGAEIADDRKMGDGSKGIATAYLRGEGEMGLVEDGVAVRGNGIDTERMLREKAVDTKAEITAQLDMCQGIVVGSSLVERGKTVAPMVGIRHSVGGEETEKGGRDGGFGRGGRIVGGGRSVVEKATSDVETIERGAGHKAEDNHSKKNKRKEKKMCKSTLFSTIFT